MENRDTAAGKTTAHKNSDLACAGENDPARNEALARHLTGAEYAHYEGDGGMVVFHLRKARELLA